MLLWADAPFTMRATICVSVDSSDECAAADAWLERWRDKLKFLSENRGCGCCVNMWNVDGPDEAIDELPREIQATSEWTRLG